MDMKQFEKTWMSSLSIFDDKYVTCIIVFILILLTSTFFPNINSSIRDFMNSKIVRLIIILLIVYIAPKSMITAVLLAILYVMSLSSATEFFENEETTTETKTTKTTETTESSDEEKDKLPMVTTTTKVDRTSTDKEDEEDVVESFIPFLSTSDFDKMNLGESSAFASPSTRSQNCLETNPVSHELIGEGCVPVQAFNGELNAQGMNQITGFNLESGLSPQPL